MTKIGFFGARSDSSGLGNQWVALSQLLRPAKVLLVDSEPFNGNPVQPERWGGYDVTIVHGLPTEADASAFLVDLDVVITIETPYTYSVYSIAKSRRIKTFQIYNYEFLDYLANPHLPQPNYFISPSYWHLDEMQAKLPGRLTYLPQPVNYQAFNAVRDVNFARSGKRRFLHVVGKPAVQDRNGTQLLIDALKYSSADFELVIKAQKALGIQTDDPRVRFDYNNPENNAELYRDFDALIMPRRYGGLCLPMQEALVSGLPVVMPNVEPNNRILPWEWLIDAEKVGSFRTRTEIDLFDVSTRALATKLDELATMHSRHLTAAKAQAFEIGYENYAIEKLRPKYQQALEV